MQVSKPRLHGRTFSKKDHSVGIDARAHRRARFLQRDEVDGATGARYSVEGAPVCIGGEPRDGDIEVGGFVQSAPSEGPNCGVRPTRLQVETRRPPTGCSRRRDDNRRARAGGQLDRRAAGAGRDRQDRAVELRRDVVGRARVADERPGRALHQIGRSTVVELGPQVPISTAPVTWKSVSIWGSSRAPVTRPTVLGPDIGSGAVSAAGSQAREGNDEIAAHPKSAKRERCMDGFLAR